MAMSHVNVELSTKAKTLSKYLGRNYEVLASVGYLKGLPNGKLGIDVEHAFDRSGVSNRFPIYTPDFHVGPS